MALSSKATPDPQTACEGTRSASTTTTPLPNRHGIIVYANSQVIGAANGDNENVIAGNQETGILIVALPGNSAITGNQILNNYIGTTSLAATGIGNGTYGIDLVGDVSGTVIENNNVCGSIAGIRLMDGAHGNTIRKNKIGFSPFDNSPILNQIGIGIPNGSQNTISENVVSGNNVGIMMGDPGFSAGAAARRRSAWSFEKQLTP